MAIRPHRFPGIFTDGKDIYTKNLVPGIRVYGEKLLRFDDIEYRRWNPYRSKLSAAVQLGLKDLKLKGDSRILYLGAASGTTVSHISDISSNGIIHAVEFSPRVFRELIDVSRRRQNIIPVLADANHPETYSFAGKVDFMYQDVAQPNQIEIFVKNARIFLNRGGYGILMLKARSINVAEKPNEIFRRTRDELNKKGFEILEVIDITRYEADHACFSLRMR